LPKEGYEDLSLQETILKTIGLGKTFKGFSAVSDVNLDVTRGTIHALIGPNGAGKTTCFNLLTKFLERHKLPAAVLSDRFKSLPFSHI